MARNGKLKATTSGRSRATFYGSIIYKYVPPTHRRGAFWNNMVYNTCRQRSIGDFNDGCNDHLSITKSLKSTDGQVSYTDLVSVGNVSIASSIQSTGTLASMASWWDTQMDDTEVDDKIKWHFLEHNGPLFPPAYQRLPNNVRFYYNGKPLKLAEAAEEAATFYAKVACTEYAKKPLFIANFFADFRELMTPAERRQITQFERCDFSQIQRYQQALDEQRRRATKAEKTLSKNARTYEQNVYGMCTIDGAREQIANYRVEPPGLFRGRGEHPKMGRIKRRLQPEDITINCSEDAKPPKPPMGHQWKAVRHDPTVSWLACWCDTIQCSQQKYIWLNTSSRIRGVRDHAKFDTARRLAECIDSIRASYRAEWHAADMLVRQRAVALYFIDRLALRTGSNNGNEREESRANTVGCCSLRVEHLKLYDWLENQPNIVVFDFLGKDSIRYNNTVEIEPAVFENLKIFMVGKRPNEMLFDQLSVQRLNEYLKSLMKGLTAKVFRTYNASITLQNQLDILTPTYASIEQKLYAYNCANRAVAILCNHQRTTPKNHEKALATLRQRIDDKRFAIRDCEKTCYQLLHQKPSTKLIRANFQRKYKTLQRLKCQLSTLLLKKYDKQENSTVALGTSKLNYLDPRITVAWCLKHNVPIEKVYNKGLRSKFHWALQLTDRYFRF